MLLILIQVNIFSKQLFERVLKTKIDSHITHVDSFNLDTLYYFMHASLVKYISNKQIINMFVFHSHQLLSSS